MSHSFSAPMNESKPTTEQLELALLVRETVAKRLRMPLDEITLEARFEDLNLDSLDMAELIFLLEDQLKKPIQLEQGVKLKTVGDVVELLANHV